MKIYFTFNLTMHLSMRAVFTCVYVLGRGMEELIEECRREKEELVGSKI